MGDFFTQYLNDIPYFILWASFGIIASLVFLTKNQKITKERIAKEVFGGFWVGSMSYILLDQLCDFSQVVNFVITSIIAFLNSLIITFLGNDFMQYIGKAFGRFVKNLADRAKKDPGYEEEPPIEEEDIENKEKP